MHDNLFVVSRLGQLRNAQAFIAQAGSTNNHLAVLYTEANPGLLGAIERNIDPGAFCEVVYVKQPDRPVLQSREKNRIIYGQIEDLLVKMVDENAVENLYLCNIDNYYSFFERVIAERGMSMRMTLLEEGLGTYANAGRRRYTQDTRADWTDVKHWARNLGLQARKAFKALLILMAALVSWVLRVDLARLKERVSVAMIDSKYRYGSIKHFDRAFVYFPDKVYSNNLVVDEVNRLDFSLEMTTPAEVMDAVEGDLVVFVSQKYIDTATYFDIVLRILDEMGITRVLFKFHPRQSKASCEKEWDAAIRRHPGIGLVDAEAIQAIPVEELMMAGKVRQLVGLTSTALMYGRAFFPGLDVVSIGSRFKALAESDGYEVSKGALAEFNRDLEVFVDVSGVRQL